MALRVEEFRLWSGLWPNGFLARYPCACAYVRRLDFTTFERRVLRILFGIPPLYPHYAIPLSYSLYFLILLPRFTFGGFRYDAKFGCILSLLARCISCRWLFFNPLPPFLLFLTIPAVVFASSPILTQRSRCMRSLHVIHFTLITTYKFFPFYSFSKTQIHQLSLSALQCILSEHSCFAFQLFFARFCVGWEWRQVSFNSGPVYFFPFLLLLFSCLHIPRGNCALVEHITFLLLIFLLFYPSPSHPHSSNPNHHPTHLPYIATFYWTRCNVPSVCYLSAKAYLLSLIFLFSSSSLRDLFLFLCERNSKGWLIILFKIPVMPARGLAGSSVRRLARLCGTQQARLMPCCAFHPSHWHATRIWDSVLLLPLASRQISSS